MTPRQLGPIQRRLLPKTWSACGGLTSSAARGSTYMSDNKSTLDELFEDGRAIDEALKEAARDARRLHKALGNPMATWKDGQVVWVRPEDINVDDDSEQEPNRPE